MRLKRFQFLRIVEEVVMEILYDFSKFFPVNDEADVHK